MRVEPHQIGSSFTAIAAVVAVFTAVAVGPYAPVAFAETDKRELAARQAFAAQRYQEALDIFANLYAEKLHPNYLRNIGRCYQNLGDPDKAITSFREYLRKARGVKPDERKEIEGYIQEMEDLKKQRDAETAAKASASSQAQPPSSSSAVATTTLTTPPPPPPDPQPNLMLTQSPQQPPPAESSDSVMSHWWFWTIVGAVVVGGAVGTAAALGAFKKEKDALCPAMTTCGGM